MVARRADEREAAALYRIERAARGEQRSLPARLRGDRVRIEQRRHVDRLQPVEVGGLVAALDLLPGRGRSLHDVERLEQHLQPFPCLDVRLGRVELGEGWVAYEVDVRTASARVSSEAV